MDLSLTKNLLKVYVGEAISKSLIVIATILVIRHLPVEEYAFYTVFLTVNQLFPALIGGGINLAMVRIASEYLSKTHVSPLMLYIYSLTFQVFLFLLLALVMLVFAKELALIFFGKLQFLEPFRYGLIAGLGVLIIQGIRSAYQAEEKFNQYILVLWIRDFFFLASLILLILFHLLNFRNIAIVILILQLWLAVIFLGSFYKNFKINELKQFITKEKKLVIDFLSSTKWLVLYIVALNAFQRLDIFMLSHFSTSQELANYGVAFRYYSMFLLLLSSIHAVLLPKFSKVEMQDVEKQKRFALKWFKMLAWVAIPIVVLDLFGKGLFVWINGNQYERAFYIFAVFSIGIWISLLFSPLVNIIMSRKDFKYLFFLGFIAFIINLTGNLLLIPLYGGLGAAVVTIVSHAFINILASLRIFTQKTLNCSGQR